MGLQILQEETIEAINASSAWPNTIFGKPEIRHLENLSQKIRAGNLPPGLIMIRPENSEILYAELSEKGFRHMMTWPGMAFDISNQPVPESKADLTLVETEATFQEWLNIVNTSLFNTNPLNGKLMKKILHSDQFLLLALTENKAIVATSMCFVHKNRIGIYMVATDERHRRKGFAHSLTLKILQFAKDRGYQEAYLQSSAMAESLYTKILGFGFEAPNNSGLRPKYHS